jgi:uncharacterized glyoxalase superfamily protein PhnB
MVDNPPAGFPRVSPYLYYRDVGAALEFLTGAFGFTVRGKVPRDDGSIMHAEIRLADGMVMLGNPQPDFEGPGARGYRHAVTYVYVDDVDAHFRHARDNGAKIAQEPADQFYGDRTYVADDPEGHRWFFAQHVRDPS